MEPMHKRNMECWYCRKPGHTQNFCKKRIARGANLVLKPQSVAEITMDNIGYHDGTDDDEYNDENEDKDTYLNDALQDDQNIDSIDIAVVHFN